MLWLSGVVLVWFALVGDGVTVVLTVVDGFIEAFVGGGVVVPGEDTGVVEGVVLLSVVGAGLVLL